MQKAFALACGVLLTSRALFASFQTAAQAPGAAPTPPAASRPHPMTATVVLKVPGMDRTRVRPDIVYSTVGGMKLAADLYLPPGPAARSRPPVVVLVAGGAENPKAWGIYTSLGRLLAASGLAAVPFNHRLRYPRRQYEEGAADLLAVIAHLQANAGSLGIDAGRSRSSPSQAEARCSA